MHLSYFFHPIFTRQSHKFVNSLSHRFRLIFSPFIIKTFRRNVNYQPKKFNPFRRRNPGFYEEDYSKIADRICLTILGNGAVGQPRCLAMFTDKKNYLFNCGENVARLCREHDINLCDCRNVFVTQKSWRNVSGITDIYLTNNTSGFRTFCLHGPPGIEEFMQIVMSTQKDVKLRTRSHLDAPFKDDTIEVEFVPTQKPLYPKSKHSRYRSFEGTNKDLAMSYICKVQKRPGDLMPEKCIEYGVPIGPLLLKLKNGEDVTLSSGKLVRSCDVNQESCPGFVFLVVDCPSNNLLEEFVSEPKFHPYQLPADKADSVSAVFHFSPPHVVNSPRYQQWIHRFHQNVYHMILNSDNSTASSALVHEVQHVLHLLHPRIFALLKEKKSTGISEIGGISNIIKAENLQQLHLRPIKKLDSSNVVQLNPEKYIENIKDKLSSNEDAQKLNLLIKEKFSSFKAEDSYPEVLFLGTGSSLATPYRNVSGILLNTSERNSVLLDCGEGTFMQLARSYGIKVDSVLQKISCIFVSHKHTDHYMGLFEIIKARKEAFERSLKPYRQVALVLPVQIEKAIMDFNDIFEPILSDVRIFSSQSLTPGKDYQNHDLKDILKNIELTTVQVIHCYDSYGVVLKDGLNWKIVYSGDTSPCQRLIDEGKDCTLLIHETTLEDGMVNEASNKYHSTPFEVMDISKRMNAKYTIMTHFSKRYLAVPVLEEYDHLHRGCAFDFMKVRICDLPLLPYFLPIIRSFFPELLEQHSERTTNVTSFENVFMRTLKSQL